MLSCADLSDKIHKSLPVTAKLLSKLIEDGWVIETGFAASTGGRRPVGDAFGLEAGSKGANQGGDDADGRDGCRCRRQGGKADDGNHRPQLP